MIGGPSHKGGAINLDRAALEVGKLRRFLPYLQKYEFEALLFSSPLQIADAFDLPQTRNAIESILSACTGPEKINDNPVSAPSKRLQALFPAYDKKLYGPIIAQEIGLSAIRSRCPRFDGWMSRLEDF